MPAAVATYYRRSDEVMPERIWQYVEKDSGDSNMRKISDLLGVDYVSARDAFCNNRGCVTRIGELLVARDSIHLTPVGSIFLINSIAPELDIAG